MVITRGAVFEEHEETAPQFASNTLVLKGPYPTWLHSSDCAVAQLRLCSCRREVQTGSSTWCGLPKQFGRGAAAPG